MWALPGLHASIPLGVNYPPQRETTVCLVGTATVNQRRFSVLNITTEVPFTTRLCGAVYNSIHYPPVHIDGIVPACCHHGAAGGEPSITHVPTVWSTCRQFTPGVGVAYCWCPANTRSIRTAWLCDVGSNVLFTRRILNMLFFFNMEN